LNKKINKISQHNTMKKIIIAVSIFFAFQAQAQRNVMTVDGKQVSEQEFLQIYLKNNNDPKFDKESMDTYIELFKKFKLKVAEAEALGYDTIPKLKNELAGYRKQLATPYLIDSAANYALVEQAYTRSKEEIRAAHILIKCDENASPNDTLIAYNKLFALKKRIANGEDFATVAKGNGGSEDPSAKMNGGDLGFFTAFQMVYPFEEAAYNTAVGQLSNIVRTRFGYHFLKVSDKRAARGTLKTAHIMVAIAKEATQEEKNAAEKKINELHELLKKGANFEETAKIHSDDPSSNSKGGVLPPFGTGTSTRMIPEFEDAGFLLKADNDFSMPILTQYGYHIIKRLELLPVPTFDKMKKDLQTKVNKDERAAKTQDFFITKLKKEYNYKYTGKKSLKWFNKNIDSTYLQGTWNASKLTSNKALFVINKKKFTQKDFAEYLVKSIRSTKKMTVNEIVVSKYKAFEKESILAYEESRLEMKHADFKALMKEYHDGVLLYEVMNDQVWQKASKDTSGLKSFFEQNKSKYQWKDRVNATVYECTTEKIASEVYNMLKSSDTINSKQVIAKINKDTELNLKVRTNTYETQDIPYLKNQNINKGLNKVYAFENKFYVIKVEESMMAQGKTLQEARGMAVSDYQNELEKTWLSSLAIKHPIIINKDVLYNLKK
jgi:peptidyl-prolyl cis-trans isomerase SurA